MSDAGGQSKPYDAAEHWRQHQERLRRQEERLARWIVPGPGDDPALVQLPDGRPVWTVVTEIWARNLDLERAAAEVLHDRLQGLPFGQSIRRRGGDLIGVLSRSVPAEALPAPPALPDFDALPPALRAALAACRVDLMIEKHEGPWNLYWPYDSLGPEDLPQFALLAGRAVLLPEARSRHAELAVRRALTDGQTLLLELRDGWAERTYNSETFGGKLAVCDRWPGHAFFVGHTYHEWYAVGPGAGGWGRAPARPSPE
jgi:hypothetical protein